MLGFLVLVLYLSRFSAGIRKRGGDLGATMSIVDLFVFVRSSWLLLGGGV